MLALNFYDRRDLRLEYVATPEPSAGELRVQITDAGLSQTQINEFIEGPYIINHTPHPLTGIGTPLVPCQEYGGIVDRVGEGVDTDWVGAQVAVLPLIHCQECRACRSGREELCPYMGYYGLLGGHGGFAEYSIVSPDNLVEVRERDRLTFIEPLLVGIHAGLRAGGPLAEQSVLVLGAGAVGCSVAAVFKYHFGANVRIHDMLEQRLARAEAIGLELHSGHQWQVYDTVVDAAGQDSFAQRPAYTEALAFVAPGGQLIHIGTYFHPVSVVPSDLLVRQISIIPTFVYNSHCTRTLPTVLAQLPTVFEPLITRIPLDNVIEAGYYRGEFDKDGFTRLVAGID